MQEKKYLSNLGEDYNKYLIDNHVVPSEHDKDLFELFRNDDDYIDDVENEEETA